MLTSSPSHQLSDVTLPSHLHLNPAAKRPEVIRFLWRFAGRMRTGPNECGKKEIGYVGPPDALKNVNSNDHGSYPTIQPEVSVCFGTDKQMNF